MSNQKKTTALVQGALIAALYAAATYLSGAFGIAYGPIQFRLSEVLTILPVFTSAAVPGLAIGCVLGNIGSPMGIYDIVFGTLATLLAALASRKLRNVRIKSFPVLSAIMPVLFNAVVIGVEILFLIPSEKAGFTAFLINAAEIACGELVVCVGGGIPVYFGLKKSKIFHQ